MCKLTRVYVHLPRVYIIFTQGVGACYPGCVCMLTRVYVHVTQCICACLLGCMVMLPRVFMNVTQSVCMLAGMHVFVTQGDLHVSLDERAYYPGCREGVVPQGISQLSQPL